MRLVSAALRIRSDAFVKGYLILPCVRHGDGYNILHELGRDIHRSHITEGFVDNHGNFWTREDAVNEFWNDLSATTRYQKTQEHSEKELYSEDLY